MRVLLRYDKESCWLFVFVCVCCVCVVRVCMCASEYVLGVSDRDSLEHHIYICTIMEFYQYLMEMIM